MSKNQVPVYCYQCVAGPDLMKVEVEDGVATRVVSKYDIRAEHPGSGQVCVKAYGLIQKTYNPDRIKQLMKRTNPRKGRGHDPGFVSVSWDEALDLVAAKAARGARAGPGGRVRISAARRKLRRRRHPAAVHGYVPCVPVRLGERGSRLRGGPWGEVLELGARLRGAVAPGVHRRPGQPYTNYILSFGHNGEASGGGPGSGARPTPACGA